MKVLGLLLMVTLLSSQVYGATTHSKKAKKSAIVACIKEGQVNSKGRALKSCVLSKLAAKLAK